MGESINEKLSGLYIAIIFSVRLVVVFLLKKINQRLYLLSIKLIAELGEGGLEAKAKVRSEKQIIKFFNSHFEGVTENVKYIDMMHAMNNELSEKVANSIKVIKPQIKEIPQFFVDPIIATHAGKGAVAVMYCTE